MPPARSSKVDLPEPFGPRTAHASSDRIVSEIGPRDRQSTRVGPSRHRSARRLGADPLLVSSAPSMPSRRGGGSRPKTPLRVQRDGERSVGARMVYGSLLPSRSLRHCDVHHRKGTRPGWPQRPSETMRRAADGGQPRLAESARIAPSPSVAVRRVGARRVPGRGLDGRLSVVPLCVRRARWSVPRSRSPRYPLWSRASPTPSTNVGFTKESPDGHGLLIDRRREVFGETMSKSPAVGPVVEQAMGSEVALTGPDGRVPRRAP